MKKKEIQQCLEGEWEDVQKGIAFLESKLTENPRIFQNMFGYPRKVEEEYSFSLKGPHKTYVMIWGLGTIAKSYEGFAQTVTELHIKAYLL